MDLLDVLANDVRPIDTETREALLDAVRAAAREHDGLVSIAWIRPHLPEWAQWPGLGAFVSALVRQGTLVWTGQFTLNGNTKTRNALRPAKVYRFTEVAA